MHVAGLSSDPANVISLSLLMHYGELWRTICIKTKFLGDIYICHHVFIYITMYLYIPPMYLYMLLHIYKCRCVFIYNTMYLYMLPCIYKCHRAFINVAMHL